jgi:hypothetical protein
MAYGSQENKSATGNEEQKDIFITWTDSYKAVSKMWEDSYQTLYKPWLETTKELYEKAAEISTDAAPQKYKEFYDDWMKTYQNTFGKFYPMPTPESTKEMLEKFMASAEESNRIYRSWIAELEDNSQKTRKVLQGKPDPALYKECYTMWMKSYEKIFDDLLVMPATIGTKGIFKNYKGIPDIYSDSFVQISKLWKDSFAKMYEPWTEPISELSDKMAEISRGNAGPEAYKEFYNLWLNTYQKTYGKVFDFQSMQPSKEVFEDFMQNTNIYLNVYKTWIATLEELAKESKEISEQTTDPKAYEKFYTLWAKMYEKAFDSFFEDMPVAGPMKEMMEPLKIMAKTYSMAKIYSDNFTMMPKMWAK